MCPIELMQRYCDGDELAFRGLYSLAAPRVLRYLKRLTSDRATAEDLLQQTFLKLHQARAVYVRGADPLPWIYTIAHRTFLDGVRRTRRSPVAVAKAATFSRDIATDIQGRILDNLPSAGRDEATQAAVLAAVERLSDSHRRAIVETKLHNRPFAEAAAMLGTTPGALKVRAHRAYAALRLMLSEGAEV